MTTLLLTNYTTLFYLLTVGDSAKDFFFWIAIISTVLFALFAITKACYMAEASDGSSSDTVSMNEWAPVHRKFIILFTILSIVMWTFYLLTPTKKDALLILAGGTTMNYLTKDSVARQVPREVFNYVTTELRSMAAEAKVDIKIADTKDDILKKAKKMTQDELIEQIKTNATFRDIILGKDKSESESESSGN